MPAWYKPEKLGKFHRHWEHRKGLQMILMEQIAKYGNQPTDQQRHESEQQVGAYIAACYEHEKLMKLKDVYITDHKPVEKKKVTYSEEEDQDFFDYEKAVEEYNNDTSDLPSLETKRSRYERGSLLQKVFEPFAFADRDENGTIIYKVEDSEIKNYHQSEESLRKTWEAYKEKGEVWEQDADDESFDDAVVREQENR